MGKVRTVLLISYFFPPGDRVGSARISKFQKYLPDFDYQSCVLCSRVLGRLDDDRANKVFRPYEPALAYRPLLRFITSRDRKTGDVSASNSSRAERGQRFLDGTRFEKARDWFRKWFMIPDLQILWLPFAVWTGYKVIKQEQVDVIISTSGPETNHLVGACLSALTGIPLVVDFRDGWMFEPLSPFRSHGGFRKAMEGMLERRVIARADSVTTVSTALTEYFRDTYNLPQDRCKTIPNGYDPTDWESVYPKPRVVDKFWLVYTGAFGGSRGKNSPRSLFESLTYLSPTILDQLRVVLVGYLSEAEQQILTTLNMSQYFELISHVSHAESLSYQLSADVLLLLTGPDRSVATSKLYEYLYAQRPILAIGNPKSAGCEIVRATGAGMVVADFENPQAIADAITKLFDFWRKGTLNTFTPSGLDIFDRRNQTKELAALLDRLIGDWQS